MYITRYAVLIRRSFVTLCGLLLASTAIIYAISPRRNPTFIPTSSNAGSQIPVISAIPESAWLILMMLFAVVLATNCVLLLFTTQFWPKIRIQSYAFLNYLLTGVVAAALWWTLAYSLWLGMLLYLLVQSIVD